MQLKWFDGCKSADDKKKREQLVRNCHEALDILSKICYNSIKNERSPSKADYDSPSWAYKQADTNGYIRAMEDIMKMCKLTD